VAVDDARAKDKWFPDYAAEALKTQIERVTVFPEGKTLLLLKSYGHKNEDGGGEMHNEVRLVRITTELP
jgi:hypothetical protein